MKRLCISVLPMILLLVALVITHFLETVFMDEIINLFNLEGAFSINIFNRYFVIFLGLLTIYLLSKYIMEINERIFRIFTFVVNVIGIIIIITIIISGQYLMWRG